VSLVSVVSFSTLMYLLATLYFCPFTSSPYPHLGVHAAALSTPSCWELLVAVRAESPFNFGQKRHDFRFGPTRVEGFTLPRVGVVRIPTIAAVPKQVPPMMIAV
jgi:hypothetical protein